MGDSRSFDKPDLDHGCSGSGGDSCSNSRVCVCSGSQHCCSDGGVSDHWICIGRRWYWISFHKGVAVGLGLLGGGLLVLALGVLAVWLVVWCFGWFVPWAVKGIAELCKRHLARQREECEMK